MKYTREERLAIGKRLHERELKLEQAAVEYGIGTTCAKNYLRLYRQENHLEPAARQKQPAKPGRQEPADLQELRSMTKEELIDEVVRARIREARLKKGYEVKGDGTVIRYVSRNTK